LDHTKVGQLSQLQTVEESTETSKQQAPSVV